MQGDFTMNQEIMQAENINLISVENNEPITSSLIVADVFGKQHKHVLRDIDRIIGDINQSPILDSDPLFVKTLYVSEVNGQSYPMYQMNRDGFTLLAMGFTGPKAFEWKLKYIAAFNEMERRLKAPKDDRLEIAKLIVSAPPTKLVAITALYPEYFAGLAEVGSLEHRSELNTSYTKWIEDYNITSEWIADFPTTDIYKNYVRYCMENHFPSMGKKYFYRTLEKDFNMIKRQKSDGHRYFMSV